MELKKRLRLIKRAAKIEWSINRALVLSKLLEGITAALGPIAAVWFSAQILNKLTGHAEPRVLLLWADVYKRQCKKCAVIEILAPGRRCPQRRLVRDWRGKSTFWRPWWCRNPGLSRCPAPD